MKKIILIITCLLLVGCNTVGLKTVQTNNPNVKCTVLFDFDGVRVYRFEVGSSYRYFARVIDKNEVSTFDSTTHSTGKTTYTNHNQIYTVDK